MADRIEFGTDGWRAIIADKFTFDNVERVASAIGLYVQEAYGQSGTGLRPVLIGYDTRFLADRFALRAAQVLSKLGVTPKLSVHDLPTPCLAFAAQNEPSAGALQFTASHNPPEYCGIKYITPEGGPATKEITARILDLLPDKPSFNATLSEEMPCYDFKPAYLQVLTERVDLARIGASKLRVCYDALYSTSRGYLDQIVEKAGVELRVLHNWRDANFGGGMPEPKKEYLKEMMALVKTHQLDCGIATDGDADRFAVIDERGEFMPPNQLVCLLASHLVKNRGFRGAIVRTVATTHMLDHLAKRYGCELVETPVGFKYIGEQMRLRDVLIGGEESGGVSIKGHIPEKDGILANLLVLEMMAVEGKSLSRIWQDLVMEIGKSLVARRADLKLPASVQADVMARLSTQPFSQLAQDKVSRVSDLDGLKFHIDDDNWLMVRASGTEPLLRLYAEADTANRADAILADSKIQIELILTSLTNSAKLSVQRDIAKLAP
jgi:phosphomannomutase